MKARSSGSTRKYKQPSTVPTLSFRYSERWTGAVARIHLAVTGARHDSQSALATMASGTTVPRGVAIRTPDQRLRVFVSSTMAELADERRSVSRAISALRLTPVMFEAGARPQRPQDVYRAYLDQSDVFVGLYWQSYGRVAPGEQVSGLEEEFERSGTLPRLLYVKDPAPEREPRLADLIGRIRLEASYRKFRTARELGRLVRDDLAALLSERFATGAPAAVDPTPAPAAGGPRPLPVATTSLVGREQAIEDVADLLERRDARLVTLTGPGGVGKTRLALAVGERVSDRFGSGIALVPLAAVTEPEVALAGVARAVGLALTGPDTLEALVERFADGRWLLILDNLEQVLDVARNLDQLLTRCAGLAILATSLTALRLRAEREYPVPPLPAPADPASVPLDELAASPAVALFLDRARAARPDFAVTADNAAEVVEICRRLEGLPLALELAAARTRTLDPAALLARLASSFDALGRGTVDMPDRHQTLRDTVEWSVGLLDDDERSLLETLSVFVDGWTVEAASEVAGLDEDRVLELTEALARHSLVYLDTTERGTRPRLLDTIRTFVAERLAARPDAAEIERRHADYYRALADAVDRSLRSDPQNELAARFEPEMGNLAAAVRWYLSNDRAPLPHLFRILAVFWTFRDPTGQARSWIRQLLPEADSLGFEEKAELLCTATIIALQAGDDSLGLEASLRLAPLLDGIEDPHLRAVSELALAWASPIQGDVDRTERLALSSHERFRSRNEPLWTAVSAITAGLVEMGAGRYDDAIGPLSEGHDLAERFDSVWLTALAKTELGALAVRQDRLEDALPLLDDGLSLSLAVDSTLIVAPALLAFADFALAQGESERAALMAGAAEGMRERARVRAWPSLRAAEDHLMTDIREALGPDRFERAFAEGSRLDRRSAVAAARERGSAAGMANGLGHPT